MSEADKHSRLSGQAEEVDELDPDVDVAVGLGPRPGPSVERALRVGRDVQLVEHLCGWGEEVSHNAIEVYMHRLRKKLESSGATIATVRGLGYCFEKSAKDARS